MTSLLRLSKRFYFCFIKWKFREKVSWIAILFISGKILKNTLHFEFNLVLMTITKVTENNYFTFFSSSSLRSNHVSFHSHDFNFIIRKFVTFLLNFNNIWISQIDENLKIEILRWTTSFTISSIMNLFEPTNASDLVQLQEKTELQNENEMRWKLLLLLFSHSSINSDSICCYQLVVNFLRFPFNCWNHREFQIEWCWEFSRANQFQF